MQRASLILGVTLALGLGVSAQAQDLIDGSNVDDILNYAHGYGSATLGKQDNGDPMITGKIQGVLYSVSFRNCTDNKNCEDIQFYSGFADNKPAMDVINAWNRDKRFGRAFLDSDLDAVVVYDVDLEHGVSPDNMDAAFSVWSAVLDEYTTYIGYK